MTVQTGLLTLAAAQVSVALGLNGKTVTPVESTHKGTVVDNELVITHEFGPFADPVDADSVMYWVAGDGPRVRRFGRTVDFPAGWTFAYELTVALTG